ncbi:acetyl esterase/lipase [Halanaerobium saccharolyticum]|uniref:Acetyl esterase/lipase n=1 Tax=Halanaerobium saccharolyticum TaxID=43595 RepID=A0A4R7YW62_9FIRM|nr:alpha/beta hydrolase [Halanaerobium saccharolyticum]RAK06890.1 acetyl esterase/lipase [Halanaerobium saccharolyticum]TDW01500.1 acetyl esterase/lipase [Halanaerobium saccharolyticum]TDX52861.1 acetyl esterase/lipase [Halanaerobium saccharolyticum]
MIDIWNGKIPGYKKTDDFAPALEKYLIKDKKSRGTILIFPGGGYTHRADHEGADVARFLNENGFNAFVLHYRVAPYKFPYPLLDALRAVKYIKSKSEPWQLKRDKPAVLGFSAGGHLASMVGTNNDLYRNIYKKKLNENGFKSDQIEAESSEIEALVLSYPVITAGEFAHQGSVENLLGKSPSQKSLNLFATDKNICAETAPTFIWHTADDASVPVENTIQFSNALSNKKIDFESHIFPNGRHGLGLAADNKYVSRWTDLLLDWLEEKF